MKYTTNVLLALGLALPAVAVQAGQAPGVMAFKSVVPGQTTAAELLANGQLGKPLSRDQSKDSDAERFHYSVKPWETVVVTVRGGVVRTIDLVPPDRHNEVEKILPSMGFGRLQPLASVPEAALLADPPQPNWTAYAPENVGAVFWVIETEGQQRVQIIRLYSASAADFRQPAAPSATMPSSPPPTAPSPPIPEAAKVDDSVSGAGPSGAAAADPNARRRQIIKTVLAVAERQHLSGHPVDDEIARRTVERLVHQFDVDRLYFMQSDIDRFRLAGATLVDELRRGEFRLAQEVLDTRLERLRERLELVPGLLELNHDFHAAETIPWGDAAEYAKTDAETRERWRKAVKYWLLVHRTAGADDLEARRRTLGMYRGFLERAEQDGPDDAVDALLDSLLGSFDPHSFFLPPVQAENTAIHLRQELCGIGASLQIENGYLTVQKIIPNGPAARDGQLQAGDRILAVGEGDEGEMVDVVGARLADVVERIRGRQGTVVRLQVLPASRFESSLYRIARDNVQVTNLAGAVLTGEILPEGRDARVGYVYLPTFYVDQQAKTEGREDYRSSTRDLQRLLKDFAAKSVDVMLLDVRNNEGGTLLEAIEMAGLFIDKGPVVQVKDRSGKIEVFSPQSTSVAWRGPLVVLTSKRSAGGAEILAGAVADYRRGLIVGDPQTNGMGTVARLNALGSLLFAIANPPDLGTIHLTAQKSYRPGGEGIQLRGVAPHVVLPSLAAVTVRGQESLPHALAHDAIAPAAFTRLDSPLDAKLQQTLSALSETRRGGSAFFAQLSAGIEQERARRERAYASLNEAEFLAQRKQRLAEGPWPKIPEISEVRVDPYFGEVLSIALDYTARAGYADAQKLYEDRQFGAGIEEHRRALLADPSFDEGHYMLAWSLATCPEAAVRDGPAAARHAKTACDLTGGGKWQYILCLAVAEAEAGDFDSALAHLKQALALAPASERSSYEYLVDRFESGRPYQQR